MKMCVLLRLSLVLGAIITGWQSQPPEQELQAALILEKFQQVLDGFSAETDPEAAAYLNR